MRKFLASLATAGLAVLLAAGPATADPTDDPATATLTSAASVKLFNAAGEAITLQAFSLEFDPARTPAAYCVDIKHRAEVGGTYVETKWDDARAKPAALKKILWILVNSVPSTPAAEVLTKAGVATPPGNADRLVRWATQAAIWHFSDGFNLGPRPPNPGQETPSPEAYAVVQAVSAYLIANAKAINEPDPSLSLSPADLSGRTGKAIGPFTVETNAGKIALTASDGAKVVDKDGKALETVRNRDQFWVLADTAGKVTVTATGQGRVPTGRVFVFQDSPDTKQQVILAQSVVKKVSAKVTVDVAAAPSPSESPSPSPSPSTSAPGGGGNLPRSGDKVIPMIGTALGLLGAGAALLVVARRRRTGLHRG